MITDISKYCKFDVQFNKDKSPELGKYITNLIAKSPIYKSISDKFYRFTITTPDMTDVDFIEITFYCDDGYGEEDSITYLGGVTMDDDTNEVLFGFSDDNTYVIATLNTTCIEDAITQLLDYHKDVYFK